MRTAIFSTYPPRTCGIGTFAFDVRTALLGVADVEDVSALVVVDDPSSPQRPEILQTISQGARGDYVRAARTLGRLDIDVVLLQHEYGIFGGRAGTYALSFARELAQPLVVTLHTVLSKPTEHQLQVLTALCHEAERVIVMTETARRLVTELGACDDEKIRVVPHGAPVALGAARAELAAGRRPRYVAPSPGGYDLIDSRFLLSSFGLISPGKGLETMIDALPAIVDRHPEVLYVIAGRTHPQVARRQGEEYRFMLERRIVDLGLGDHVQLDDRFLSVEERADVRARGGLCGGLDALLVRRGHAELGGGDDRSLWRPGRACCSDQCLDRASRAARRRERRGAAGWLRSSVALRRGGHSRRARRGGSRRTSAHTHPRRRTGAGRRAHGSSPDARRRLRHHSARKRSHSEPLYGLLRRRHRPAGGRRARARDPDRRPGVDACPLSLPRVSVRRERREWRRHAQLHELRPALARRAACRRPRRPVDLGPRRRSLDCVGARDRGTVAATALDARALASRRAVDPHRGLRDARPLASRCRPP